MNVRRRRTGRVKKHDKKPVRRYTELRRYDLTLEVLSLTRNTNKGLTT